MEIQGKDIILSVSTVLTQGSEVWKTLICLETLTVNWTRSISKHQTRCGPKIGVGVLEITVSGSSVADDAPAGTELSIKEVEGFMNGTTQVAVKVAHVTTPAKYFMTGLAYATSMNETMPSDNLLDFNFQFDITGVIDLIP